MRSIPHTTWVPEFQNNHAGKNQKYVQASKDHYGGVWAVDSELPLLQTVGISGWTLRNWLAAIKALYHRSVLADGCLNGFESSLMNGVVHQDQPVPAGIFEQRVFCWRLPGAICKTHPHTHTPHNTSKRTAKSCVLASFKVKFSSNAAASTTAPSWDIQQILAGKTYRFSRPELLGLFIVCRHLMAPAFLLLAPFRHVHATTSLLGPGSSVMRFGTSPKAEVALRRPKSK